MCLNLKEDLYQELVNMDNVTRNTAYKVWISDLVNGKYGRGQEQFDSGYVEVKGKKISRVNIIGGIVDKSLDMNYISVSLDDGSGFIKLKAWQENINLFSDVDVGDLVLVVGKVREYNNYIHVSPEIVRKLDNPLWLKIRKFELTKLYGEPLKVETPLVDEEKEETIAGIVEEKVVSGNTRGVILELIEGLDTGDGADVEDVIKSSNLGDSGRKIVEELLKGGEVFEVHSGKLRVIG